MNDAHAVHQGDVGGAVVQQQLGGGDAASPGSGEHERRVLNFAPGDRQAVNDCGQDSDGRAMLVVVEHGDAQVLQGFLNVEALGRGDVLEVDAAETGGDGPHRPDNLVGVLRGDTDGIGVHTGQVLEQDGLAFHDRHGRFGADVAEAQHRRAVGHHCDGVAPVGEVVGLGRVGVNRHAHRGHARSVGDGQFLQRFHRHLGIDADFAAALPVPPDGLCSVVGCHGAFLLFGMLVEPVRPARAAELPLDSQPQCESQGSFNSLELLAT